MLDLEQQAKLERPPQAPPPRSRDSRGRYAKEAPTPGFKLESDKYTWVPVNDRLFVRRRKARYVAVDVAILAGVPGVGCRCVLAFKVDQFANVVKF